MNSKTENFCLENYKIEELLPHSPPMVLIDEIVDYSTDHLVAKINCNKQSRFFDNTINGVPGWVGLEYMAQSIAAYAGVQAKIKHQPIKLGFLLGARKYEMLQSTFLCGFSYNVSVTQLYMDESGLGKFDCMISHQQSCFAKAKLNVYETDDINQMLKI